MSETVMFGTDGEKVVSFRNRLTPLLFMTTIFLFNFLARYIWSPLLVPIEKDLGISHTGAGSLFFLITLGYVGGLLLSGYISQKISRPETNGYSCISCGLVLAGASMSDSLLYLAISLVLIGFTTGIYLPSAIPTLTYGLAPGDYGKAYSFHEISPSLCFILGPILAEIMLRHYPWKMVLLPVAVGIFLLGIIYLAKPVTGKIYGEAPSLKSVGRILSERRYWFLLFIFIPLAFMSVFSYRTITVNIEKRLDETVNLRLQQLEAFFTEFLNDTKDGIAALRSQ